MNFYLIAGGYVLNHDITHYRDKASSLPLYMQVIHPFKANCIALVNGENEKKFSNGFC